MSCPVVSCPVVVDCLHNIRNRIDYHCYRDVTIIMICFVTEQLHCVCLFSIYRAVGRTYQAVDTHRSSHFYEIEQKERPTECALCNVSHGVHAMYPLFDYHGPGGRQICYTSKMKNKNKNSNGNENEKVLAWGHALCSLYLASVNHLYACYKDGDYIGMEEEEDDDPDTRPPNPELKNTDDFQRMYGDSMPHFRYYMTPPNGRPDAWTKAVIDNKRELKCIECGLVDDEKTMRIPLQCVANDEDEYWEHKDKHRERNNDTAPCTQALHVGCARWGDASSLVRKCYFFPGLTNDDGTIKSKQDTAQCLYCKTHAENVDESHQKRVKKEKALLEKKTVAERKRLKHKQQHAMRPMMKGLPKPSSISNRKRPSAVSSLSPVSMMKGTNYATKNKKNTTSSLVSVPKGSRGWGKYKNKEQDRHRELDPSAAVAINAGQQPTLAKRRRQLANEMSVVTKEDVNQIFDDFVSHQDKIAKNPTAIINGRKRHWKHKFSELSTVDFDSVWIKARKRFVEYQNVDSSRTSSIRAGNKNVATESSVSVDLTDSASDTEKGVKVSRRERKASGNNNEKSDLDNNNGNNDDSVMGVEDETGGADFDASEDEEMEMGTTEDDITNNRKASKRKEKKPKGEERPPDRWSKLFIGQPFEMGCEFTLDEFEESF